MKISDITKQIRAFADQLEGTQSALAMPPDGRPLCNEDELTAEQVGAGFRLRIKEDVFSDDAEVWNSARKEWRKTSTRSFDPVYTYRLPLSVPWPEAPPFQLPPPPPGMQWIKGEWKSGDLPQGTRPLAVGEHILAGDEWKTFFGGTWLATRIEEHCVGRAPTSPQIRRTTRPLTFEHAGKTWTYHRPGDPTPCDEEAIIEIVCHEGRIVDIGGTPYSPRRARCNIWQWTLGWRYAEPLTREVELGPEDVPPFSVIRRKGEEQNWHWRLLSYVHGTHAICADRGYSWSELARDYEVNHSLPLTGKWNPDAWEKCSKTITI